MLDFFDKMVRYFQKFFVYGKKQESFKKYIITVQKYTVFEISRNLIRNACFQMTLNARKSCDSFLKIKTDDN